ncbi:aminoglycoside phosphotransferase family protein [Ornithinibacillus scapharcae]|uniref:aminoglycoside phosphotransferase family protein n=1 Tax=Ornithinibacillus scapharcae TaxID=1147159 RepID=UPI000225B661|nr:aminoglycoside phosphotransferase family protein [Ornithinibacillus scapharcae]
MNPDTLIGKGNTANIYLVGNQIQKVFHDRFTVAEATYEAKKQIIAFDNGLTVPRVLDVTTIENKAVIIMEYIKGRTLGELLLEDIDNAEYYLNIAVDIHMQIHSIETTSLENMKDRLESKIEGAPILQPSHKRILMKHLEQMPLRTKLCHGDFHPFNIIMGKEGSTVIDWVDASSGDKHADVFRTYLLYSQHSIELAEQYVAIYCEKSGLLKEEIFEWAPIIAAARLSDKASTEDIERLLRIVNDFYNM